MATCQDPSEVSKHLEGRDIIQDGGPLFSTFQYSHFHALMFQECNKSI